MPEAGRQTRAPPNGRLKKVFCSCISSGCCLLLLLAFVILFLVVLPAVINMQEPSTTVVSISVKDITARTRPRLQFNLTLDIQLAVHNPNLRASFRHNKGSSLLFYHGLQIGEAEIPPGVIHGAYSKTFRTRVMIKEPDRLVADKAFASDFFSGAIHLESRTIFPGRVTILRIFHQHAVSSAVCQIAIRVSDGKVESRNCSFDK